MTDIFTKKKRSEIMSRVHSKNTKPELKIRKFLFSHGFRYRIHQNTLPGSPDIVLKRFKTVINVNGCFWHGHKKCSVFKFPKSNKKFWKSKIEKNIKRDFAIIKQLKKLGWKVITVWECEMSSSSKLNKTLFKILSKLKRDM